MTTWNVLRAAGIGAYVMLFLSVCWGLVATTTPFGKLVSKPTATLVHQFMSTSGLALLAVHLGGLVLDRYEPFTLRQLFVPMAATYRPLPVALGIVAMYLLVVIIVASWLRKQIGTAWWRRTHVFAVPTFALALAHGLLTGTDTRRPAMWWTYVATALIVVFLVLVRAFTVGLRPQRRTLPPDHPKARTAVLEPSARG